MLDTAARTATSTSFKGIDCQKAQLPIEHIDIEDVVEGGARSEGVGGSVGLEGNCVWGESIVSDVSEVSGGAIPVRDDESAFNVALNEFVLVECWFIVTLTWRIHPPMVKVLACKNPPIWACSYEREAWGVLWCQCTRVYQV